VRDAVRRAVLREAISFGTCRRTEQMEKSPSYMRVRVEPEAKKENSNKTRVMDVHSCVEYPEVRAGFRGCFDDFSDTSPDLSRR